MKRLIALSAALASGLPIPALAHAFLDHAVPAVGSIVAAAPAAVQMFYTQPLEPAFSAATLEGADGTPIATPPASIDPQNPMELVLKLPKLAPGHYKVRWHVLSVDTHRSEGAFSFDITP
jgi:methionine-rich copper-binding protein CopC